MANDRNNRWNDGSDGEVMEKLFDNKINRIKGTGQDDQSRSIYNQESDTIGQSTQFKNWNSKNRDLNTSTEQGQSSDIEERSSDIISDDNNPEYMQKLNNKTLSIENRERIDTSTITDMKNDNQQDGNQQNKKQNDNQQNDNQQNEKQNEKPISKSDIRQVINLLKQIAGGVKELEGMLPYRYDEKGRDTTRRGRAHIYKYLNYYDVTNTIKTAGPVDPNDFDSPVYNKERVFEDLERYSDIINVSNEGRDTLFVIVSHGGRTNFSKEAPVFPGEVKTYWNVYELRLRSPKNGLEYRVTEYDIMDVSESPLIPIELATLQDEPLPDVDTNWFSEDIVPQRTPTTLRFQVSVSVEGILSAVIKRGGNEQIIFFNATSGPDLLADGLYTFEILAHEGDSINFRYSKTGGSIKVLRVQEIDSATA